MARFVVLVAIVPPLSLLYPNLGQWFVKTKIKQRIKLVEMDLTFEIDIGYIKK